jgi:transcriptional regulator with XRE-family HTH domain
MKGWSLREAAKQFGVSYTTVDKWEKGENLSMRPQTLWVVAQAYGTDPEYILWGESRKPASALSR